MDREDMYRLLRMQGFKVPDTIVVRAKHRTTTNRSSAMFGASTTHRS
jgi:hypothetical protein